MIDFYIPLESWVNDGFAVIRAYLSPLLKLLSDYLITAFRFFEAVLLWLPEAAFMLIVGLLIWYLANRRLAIFAVAGLLIIYGIGIWSEAMTTVALALTGTAVSLFFGVPTGIIASQSGTGERIIRPVLDFMQTLPSFVYLIPAVMLFRMGPVAALVATMIFAMPPAVRLTNLGIREVPREMVEAARSFGSSRWQTLSDVQLPLAMPTIMAGVNQCIMMALAMTVIASMIGAGGLGLEVLRAMQTINIGKGFVAGLGIVILAITLDRLTEVISKKQQETKKLK